MNPWLMLPLQWLFTVIGVAVILSPAFLAGAIKVWLEDRKK